MEAQKQEQNEKIKYWQTRSQTNEQDKNFLQSQVIESKRQNKLLKLAIGRLQGELERKEEQISRQQSVGPLNIMHSVEVAQPDGNTFMTDVKGNNERSIGQQGITEPIVVKEVSQIYGETTAQSSLFDSKLLASKQLGQHRSSTRSPLSRYKNIATKNVKFEKFVELIFKAKMQPHEIKDEIIKYVQALETSYTDAIRDLKIIIEKERLNQRRQNAEKVNFAAEKNELETLFVDCIEEVRKEIMKRRLKNEIYNRKKFQ